MCEFHVVRGLCGRTARNLRNSLEFCRVLCRGRCLKHDVKCANFAEFADCEGELRRICVIRWNLTGEDNFENFVCNLKSE